MTAGHFIPYTSAEKTIHLPYLVLVALGAAHAEQGVIATMKEDLMLKSTFWTERRFAGIILILGCFLFLGALGLLLRDSTGTARV
jgi:hypothetical protein